MGPIHENDEDFYFLLYNSIQFNLSAFFPAVLFTTATGLLQSTCGLGYNNMASTSNIPLADSTRYHGGHHLPCPIPGQSVLRESAPIDTRDAEGAWHTEQQLPTDIRERKQVNLPTADGGKEAWLFLSGCFTIEALVWGMFEYLILS